MARSTRPISIAMSPQQLRLLDRAARADKRSRSAIVNSAVDQLLRGQFMSNSKNGTLADVDAVPYGSPKNQIGVRGYPGSTSTPAGKQAQPTLGSKTFTTRSDSLSKEEQREQEPRYTQK